MSVDVSLAQPWDRLEELIVEQNREELQLFWRTLTSSELTRAVSRMDVDKQLLLVRLLDPDDAADLLDELPHIQAADILEDLPVSEAAAIIDELDSDEQVDVLAELDDEDAAAILDQMDPLEAQDVRGRVQYDSDTAGGLMITEYLCYPKDTTVADVLADLRNHVEEYQELDVRYVYVVESREHPKLLGVVRLKDIVLSLDDVNLIDLRLREAKSVSVMADLDDLEHFFDRYDFSATPVVDTRGELVGTVLRSNVQEAVGERADKNFMRFGGIVTGEELRTMPTGQRAMRRLAFLLPVFLLSTASASVIGLFEDTIRDVTVLAMFLPLVAGLSGCSGNQSVAVSVRELALGLATKSDVIRVLFKELGVGILIGSFMGTMLFLLAWLWSGEAQIGLAVGMAVPMTIIIAVCLGGAVPLMLNAVKLDPAMASGPLVTTMTDFCSFFFVLMIATRILHLHG